MSRSPATAVLLAFILVVEVGTLGRAAAAPLSLAPVFAAPEAEPPPEPEMERGSGAAFLRDTALTLHLRTFYFDGTQAKATENEAWAGGGWLGYRSGWLLDTLAIGATLYGSVPFYAPADKDGTVLLAPGQEGYHVLGEAWGALRYEGYALLKGYRQLVDQGYINPSDIRMTPYTFEGVTVGGGVDVVQYLAGYLWKIKPRNSDTFISMAEQAGAIGSSGGVGLIGVQLRPSPDLQIDISNQYGVDTFNTVYARANYRYPLNDEWAIRLGAEFTDQRAMGAALVANAADKKWATQVGGARVQLIYRQLTLTGAFSITGSGNTIQNPWGTYPGFLSLIDAPAAQNFARANEKAWLIGAVYDFSAVGMAGLVGTLNFASGTGAIDPQTRMSVPDQRELNFKIEYRPAWLAATILRGLQLTVRGALYDQEHSGRLARQIHVILDWEWDILAPTRGTAGEVARARGR
jgi:outer membrane OprD family porin